MFINPNLSPKEISIIVHKATEMPFSGKFNTHKMDGVYLCKNCGTALYRSDDKFNSELNLNSCLFSYKIINYYRYKK